MAKRKSSPNGLIDTNIVWDDASDTYSHADIKAWLDKYDLVIGALLADREPLGTIRAFSFPDKASGADATTVAVPTGWAVCNGQTLTSAQHDFPEFAGVSVKVPDYRNKVLIGADPGHALRAAGDPATAPGIKGQQGANTFDPPDHFHTHQHIHRLGKVAGVETYHAVPADGSSGGLNDSPANNPCTINTDAAGTGHNVTLQGHAHQMAALYSSGARDPAQPSIRVVDAPTHDGSAYARTMTSLQRITDGTNGEGTGDGQTGSATETPNGVHATAGNAAGNELTVETTQESEGVYWIMKVKWGSDYNRPWTVRSPSGVTTVGTA